MSLKSLERLVWCDIETSSLDPKLDLLLEVGFVITDLELEIQDMEAVTIYDPEWKDKLSEERLDPYVFEMHTKSGLLKDLPFQGISFNRAYDRLHGWLLRHEITRDDPLCGSSVHFDRSWLKEWMPESEKLFSYRNIDISSLKELMMRYSPHIYEDLEEEVPKMGKHRVLPDLNDSIAEFKFYRKEFLYVPLDFNYVPMDQV